MASTPASSVIAVTASASPPSVATIITASPFCRSASLLFGQAAQNMRCKSGGPFPPGPALARRPARAGLAILSLAAPRRARRSTLPGRALAVAARLISAPAARRAFQSHARCVAPFPPAASSFASRETPSPPPRSCAIASCTVIVLLAASIALMVPSIIAKCSGDNFLRTHFAAIRVASSARAQLIAHLDLRHALDDGRRFRVVELHRAGRVAAQDRVSCQCGRRYFGSRPVPPDEMVMVPVAASTLVTSPSTPRFCQSSRSCCCFAATSACFITITASAVI